MSLSSPPPCYAWSPAAGALYAANRSRGVYYWDVTCEMCAAHLMLPNEEDGSTVSSLAVSGVMDALVAAGTTRGTVTLFDLRTSGETPVMTVAGSPGGQPVRGMALEHALMRGRLVTVWGGKGMRIIDLRGGGGGGGGGGSVDQATLGSSAPNHTTLKDITAVSHSGMVAFAAHETAPLVATLSQRSAVKLWDCEGTPRGALAAPSRGGRGTGGGGGALAFHPLAMTIGAALPGESGAHLIDMVG